MSKKATTFQDKYQLQCLRSGTAPLHAIEAKLKERVLDFHYFRIPHTEWHPFLTTLAADTTLEKISIKIDEKDTSLLNKLGTNPFPNLTPCQKTKLKHTPELMHALASSLQKTTLLKHLALEGLPLKLSEFQILAEGLASNSSVECLSLQNTPVSIENLRLLTTVLKNKPSLVWLNLTNCQLNPECAESLTEMIQHQSVCRRSAVWKESLRSGLPNLEAMAGLRRLTLCQNQIGDSGLTRLASALKDDLRVKLLELHKCGMTDAGGQIVVKLLREHNATLSLVDVRDNKEISWEVLDEIRDLILTRNSKQVDTRYLPLPVAKASTASPKKLVRKVVRKSPLKSRSTPNSALRTPGHPSTRMSATSSTKLSRTPLTTSQLTPRTPKCDSESDFVSQKLLAELEDERRMRLEAEKRVLELAEQLESESQRYLALKDRYRKLKTKKKSPMPPEMEKQGVWVDIQTMEAIRASLARTHTVLATLKANGVDQFAARVVDKANSPRSGSISAHSDLKSHQDMVDHVVEPLSSLKEDLQAVLSTLRTEALPEPSLLPSLNHSFLSDHAVSEQSQPTLTVSKSKSSHHREQSSQKSHSDAVRGSRASPPSQTPRLNLVSEQISSLRVDSAVSKASKTLKSSHPIEPNEDSYSISFEKPSSAPSKPQSKNFQFNPTKSMSVSSNISSIMDFLSEITINSDVSPP